MRDYNEFENKSTIDIYDVGPVRVTGVVGEQRVHKVPKKKSKAGKTFAVSLLVLSIGFGSFGLGLGIGQNMGGNAPVPEAPVQTSIGTYAPVVHSADDQTAVDVIKNVQKSVVSINVTTTTSNYFYGNYEVSSAGSGIIFYEDDSYVYIVTNNHVISGANSVSVSVDDNNRAGASFVGSDSDADIAVIKSSKADLQAAGITDYKIASFGDASVMEVGETAIAIGNAYGEGKTATMGIISAKDKEIKLNDNITLEVLQTDAAINPGNSGGALVNLSGQVIGVNTAKLAESEAEGMGYAIPSNTVKAIVEDIIENGSVERPYIGLQGYDITEDVKEAYSFPSTGVYVVRVSTENRVPVNDLKAGDIIVSYDSQPVSGMTQLQEFIGNSKVGTQHTLGVYRGSELIEVTVNIRNSNVDSNF